MAREYVESICNSYKIDNAPIRGWLREDADVLIGLAVLLYGMKTV